jgi:3-oxoacyl-[acyl-carrier-protein] synthase-1
VSPQARISRAALAFEEQNRVGGGTSQGHALTAVMKAAAPAQGFSGVVYDDLNGEEWRARELGTALARVGELYRAARFTHPASMLGDTGAASGAVAMCLAARSFVRGYATSKDVLILSSSEHGHVGVLGLRWMASDERAS